MLASSLLRQQAIRCGLKNFNKNQTLISKIPKTSSSLIPSQFLATTAVQRSGDHVKLWTAERFVSLAQIPALIVPFVWTNFGTDVAFCTLAVLHSHWGKLVTLNQFLKEAAQKLVKMLCGQFECQIPMYFSTTVSPLTKMISVSTLYTLVEVLSHSIDSILANFSEVMINDCQILHTVKEVDLVLTYVFDFIIY